MKPCALKARDWGLLSQEIVGLCSRYREDLGENAYAVFNAITEFASHPPKNRCIHRDRHSFQRLAGEWMSNFNQEYRQPGFTISKYLERLNKANGDSAGKAKGAHSILVRQ